MTTTIYNSALSFPNSLVESQKNEMYKFKDTEGLWLRETGGTTYIFPHVDDFWNPKRKEKFDYYLIIQHDINEKYTCTYVPSSHKEYSTNMPDVWVFTAKDCSTYSRKALIIRIPKQMKKGICFALNESTWFLKEPSKEPTLIHRGDGLYARIGLGGKTEYI